MNLLALAICILMSTTLIVLILGIVFMAIGGPLNIKYSKKLMMLRISLQAASVATVMLYFMLL